MNTHTFANPVQSLAILAILLVGLLLPTAMYADGPNVQPWTQVMGSCTNLGGAIFARSVDGCGGTGTSFDSQEIFPPMVLRDSASAAVPCENGRTSGICFRMWYVGIAADNIRRIGYALSPDGINWSRYIGTGTGGSIFEASGIAGTFDQTGVTTLSIVHDGATYRMWYTGIGANAAIEGIGYAISTDAINWVRVQGNSGTAATNNEHAVLVERGGADNFDERYVIGPSVIIDQATPALPCANNQTSGRCYRMWFEGVREDGGFSVGYAVSTDGVAWELRPGNASKGAVLSGSGSSNTEFDGNSIGLPAVVKDGAIYRMWYEAKDNSTDLERFSTGHVVSTDGINWVRPDPNLPVYTGADDTSEFTPPPDNVWAARMLKIGPTYEMRYATSTRPRSQRFALARMTPGTELTIQSFSRVGSTYTIVFNTNAIPAGGSVLLTPPAELPFGGVVALSATGFGNDASFVADPAAVTDVYSGGVARGALLVRVPSGAAAGPKTLVFQTGSIPTGATPLLIQVFNTREVIHYAQVALITGDLAISKTNNRTSVVAGAAVTYTIEVTNNGQDTINSVAVSDNPPAALGNVTWTCSATSGSFCPASGLGAINQQVNLLPAGKATFTLTGKLAAGSTGSLSNSATVTAPSGTHDPDSTNNSANDTDPIIIVSNPQYAQWLPLVLAR